MAITIQRFPRAGGASTTKTLAEWGIALASCDSAAWVVGKLSLVARGASPAFDNPIFEYLDVLKVFEGATCIWWGPVISIGSTVQPAEQRTYLVADPLWWAQYRPFVWPYTPEPEEIDVLRGAYWISYALGQVPEIALTALGSFTAPCPDLRGSAHCLAVLQQVARLHPGSVQWWDLSGDKPEFRACSRGESSAVSLARSRCVEPITLDPLHDQQLTGVWIDYVWTSNLEPGGSRQSTVDTCGPGPYTGPNALRYAVKVGTTSPADSAANSALASQAQNYHVAELIYAARAALPWSGSLTVVGTPANPLPAIRPGQLLNLTEGRTEWASMNAQVQRISRTIGEVCDRLTIELGLGEHLGPQDFGALARGGGVSGGAGGGNPSPWDPPTPPPSDDSSIPGTYDDLNNSGLGGTPVGSIAVEARGGNWSLCGFPPYEGGALIRYKTKNLSGSAARGSSWVMALSGATTYNPATACRQSTTGQIVRSGFQLDWDCGVAAGTFPVGDLPGDACLPSSQVVSPTRRIIPSTANVASTMAAVLADPDTPDSAIARLLAAEPEWVAGVTGIRTIPTSGITGQYRELRYRTEHTEGTGESAVTYPTLTGLAPWWRYRLTVNLERRPVDEAGNATGAWTSAGTREYYIIADLDGEGGVDWQAIAPDAGYELRVASTTVEAA